MLDLIPSARVGNIAGSIREPRTLEAIELLLSR